MPLAYQQRWVHAGSVIEAGCHYSCRITYQDDTYRLQSEKRLGCFERKVLAFVRSPVALDEAHRQFHGS